MEAHCGKLQLPQAALQAGLQTSRVHAMRAISHVGGPGVLASCREQLSINETGLGGHKQHAALDGGDAQAAAQRLDGLADRSLRAAPAIVGGCVYDVPACVDGVEHG